MTNIKKAKLALLLLGGGIIAKATVPTGYGLLKDMSAFKRTSLAKDSKRSRDRNSAFRRASMNETNELLRRIANNADGGPGAYPRAASQSLRVEPLA